MGLSSDSQKHTMKSVASRQKKKGMTCSSAATTQDNKMNGFHREHDQNQIGHQLHASFKQNYICISAKPKKITIVQMYSLTSTYEDMEEIWMKLMEEFYERKS